MKRRRRDGPPHPFKVGQTKAQVERVAKRTGRTPQGEPEVEKDGDAPPYYRVTLRYEDVALTFQMGAGPGGEPPVCLRVTGIEERADG